MAGCANLTRTRSADAHLRCDAAKPRAAPKVNLDKVLTVRISVCSKPVLAIRLQLFDSS